VRLLLLWWLLLLLLLSGGQWHLLEFALFHLFIHHDVVVPQSFELALLYNIVRSHRLEICGFCLGRSALLVAAAIGSKAPGRNTQSWSCTLLLLCWLSACLRLLASTAWIEGSRSPLLASSVCVRAFWIIV